MVADEPTDEPRRSNPMALLSFAQVWPDRGPHLLAAGALPAPGVVNLPTLAGWHPHGPVPSPFLPCP